MEDALNDPAQIRQLLAELPPLPWADQTQAEHDAELARTSGARTALYRHVSTSATICDKKKRV
jgi:hypothetical protein